MYKVLFDYRSENFTFLDKRGEDGILREAEFDTVDEAVKAAIGQGYANPFRVVKIIDWDADSIEER